MGSEAKGKAMSKADWNVPFEGATLERYRAWQAYHKQNPHVWVAFRAVAMKQLAQGETRLSAKEIFERIRKEVARNQATSIFALCNTWSGYYARAFERMYPQFKGYFELRQLEGV